MTDPTPLHTSLREQLQTDLAAAESKAPCGVEAATLRLILCAVHDRDAAARAQDAQPCCDDRVILDVLQLMMRQREESSSKFEDAGRIEMAEKESEEADVIRRYLPPPMDDKALRQTVDAVIIDLEARSLKDLGRCMTEIKTRIPDADEARKAGKMVKKALCG